MLVIFHNRYACPISVARHIMEHSPHNILVGAGARKYAEKNGFALQENNLLVSSSKHVFQVIMCSFSVVIYNNYYVRNQKRSPTIHFVSFDY